MYNRHGIVVRILYLVVALLWWCGTSFGRAYRGRVVILCYHSVKPYQAARCAWQVQRVAGRAIGVSDLTSDRAPRQVTTAVCFTFDDAFANLLDNALPMLRDCGAPACVFAVPENLGNRPGWGVEPNYSDAAEQVMTADQVRQAVAGGLCVLGSHTCTHPDLTELPMATVAEELKESRRKLTGLVGQPIDDLALPYGSFTPGVLDAAFAAGYTRVYTLEPTPHTPSGNRQVIGRFLMSPDAWRIEFLLTCEGAYSWLHPWRRLLHRLRGTRETAAQRRCLA